MNKLYIIFLLLTNFILGQANDEFLSNFLLEDELKADNLSEKFSHHDFANLWLITKNYNVLGIIGADHQRIEIKLISIFRISNNPSLYTVYGKSKVKNNICEFYGEIFISEIREVKEMHYGVDNEYSDKGIKSQGIIIAGYEFKENTDQNHNGIFTGKLYSKWYLNSKDEIKYDNIQSISDGYTNNAFIGNWNSNSTETKKICNWGDFRVPMANQDFDIGAGEFSPNEKYHDKGWLDYKQKESKEWWK